MRKNYRIITTFIIALLFIGTADARMFRINQIPNGTKFRCANCHINPDGGGKLTPFGLTVGRHLNGQNVEWSPELANIDSDSDGFTNGQELLDPDGTWKIGDNPPGNPNNVGNPGDDKSIPIISSIIEIASSFIEVSPNPIGDNAALSFTSSEDINVSINLISLTGVKLNTIYRGNVSAGRFYLNWQPIDSYGNKLPAGIYLLNIETENQTIVKKVLIK